VEGAYSNPIILGDHIRTLELEPRFGTGEAPNQDSASGSEGVTRVGGRSAAAHPKGA